MRRFSSSFFRVPEGRIVRAVELTGEGGGPLIVEIVKESE